MTPAYVVVLLDLDGTLIDSEPGVQEALRHALVADAASLRTLPLR